MSPRYASVPLILCASILSACASNPPEHSSSPPSATTAKVSATMIDVESEFQTALQLMKDSEWQRANEKLSAITASSPELPGPWLNLGIARVKSGDSAGAEEAFRKTLDIDNAQVTAYNELGFLYRRSGRFADAAAMYTAGLKINPNAEDIHWNLGILYDRYLPNPAQALLHFERYRELTRSDDRQLEGWIDALREQTSEINVASGAKQ